MQEYSAYTQLESTDVYSLVYADGTVLVIPPLHNKVGPIVNSHPSPPQQGGPWSSLPSTTRWVLVIPPLQNKVGLSHPYPPQALFEKPAPVPPEPRVRSPKTVIDWEVNWHLRT